MKVEAAPELLAASWQDGNAVLLNRADEDWVYRAVTAKGEEIFRHVQDHVGFDRLAALGFVRTEIVPEPPPPNGVPFKAVLRHKRIQRVLYPAEWTLPMWREALAAFCDFNLGLMEHGLCTVDAQPHNYVFDADGKPVFIDFGSLRLRRRKFWLSRGWHREFKNNFLLPVLLHNFGFHELALALKSEPFDSAFKKAFPCSLLVLLTCWLDLLRFLCKLTGAPRVYFKVIRALLPRPFLGKELTRWSDYQINAGEWKMRAVQESLAMPDIRSVLDVAGNKGAHIREAARLGKTAILTDIDEQSLEIARAEARRQRLPLFVGRLDICRPTPEWGKGLLMASSFERLRSDLVMAMAVSHHLQYRLKMPFRVFAAILDRYSKRFVLAEYVDLKDVHVQKWIGRKEFPAPHYSEAEFVRAFQAAGYQVLRRWENDEKARALYLFEKP